MITLFRAIKCWQLKTKYKFVILKLIDKQLMELIKTPKELEKKFVDSLAKIIHESNQTKTQQKESEQTRI